MKMVSMYVDIRQAAEVLARFSSGHDLPHFAIELANKIRDAAHRGELQFYTQYRDPIDGLMHVSDTANTLGAAFSIAENGKGERFVKPNGYTEGSDREALRQSQGYLYTPEPHDGEWVAYCVVSIEDVVKHPCFGFPQEKQDRIVKAHKAAAVELLPANDAPVVVEIAAEPTPVATVSAWSLTKPKRYHGYTRPLYHLLAAAQKEGNQRPTARDVVEVWRTKPPLETAKVLADSIDYYDNKGNTKAANLEAIRKAIKRMTSAR